MISEAFDFFFPFFDDLQVQKCNVKADNASPNCLTSPLSAADTVLSAAHGSSFEEQFDSAAHKHALLHWEPLLIASTKDLEDVALEFISQNVSVELLPNAFVSQLDKTFFFFDFKQL